MADNSRICLCLRKPSTLKHTEYIQECSQILGQLRATETDYLLPYFISIQQFIEKATCEFQCNTHQDKPMFDSNRIEAMLNNFQQRFSQMKTTIPSEVRKNCKLTTCQFSLRIFD